MGRDRWQVLTEPLTGRLVHRARARSGCEVWVFPMPGFARSYASLTARYGSRDVALPDGTRLPDGVAHFLEHRMFQTPAGDVFDLYASRGAAANAYTSFDHTSYLFECTSRFEENLDTLFSTLQTFHSDAAGMERERGIIAQEIAMYADDPGWRGYFQLLAGLYHIHPIRRDIAGTARTIGPIDAALLARIHAAYYAPRNLVLVAAGAVTPAAVLAQADEGLQGTRSGRRNRRVRVVEPEAVRTGRRRLRLPVDRAGVHLGLKDVVPRGGAQRIRKQIETVLALEILCEDGGRIQRELYAEGLVDSGFHGSYEDDADYAFATIQADVEDPRTYMRRLTRAFAEAVATPLTDAEVERARRSLLGRHLRRFNAPGRVAEWLLDVALSDQPLASGVDALRAATGRKVTRRARDLERAPRSWSIVAPLAT